MSSESKSAAATQDHRLGVPITSIPIVSSVLPPVVVEAETEQLPPSFSAVEPASTPDPARPTGSTERLVQVVQCDRLVRRAWYAWPFWLLGRQWDIASLVILLAIVAAIPVVQLASLGYILRAAGNLAAGGPWRKALPGTRLAGKAGTFLLLATILVMPVWLVTDLAYSAQLLEPGTFTARAWRWFAFSATFVWIAHIGWAAIRGGRWWHLLWPAPIRFMRQIWLPTTWYSARDQLWNLGNSLKFPSLWWLGARGAVGALLWTSVPVSLMIIGERAQDFKPAVLVGLIGAISMTVVMLYLPMLQILLAVRNRFSAMLDVCEIRRIFSRAPWACAFGLVILCLLAIPLYILRIEAPPRELLWLPSVVFVVLMLPSKLLIGAAMGLGTRRTKKRHWLLRWPAKFLALAGVLIYVGALYVAQFVAWQGAYVMYFQHAVLVPAPLLGN